MPWHLMQLLFHPEVPTESIHIFSRYNILISDHIHHNVYINYSENIHSLAYLLIYVLAIKLTSLISVHRESSLLLGLPWHLLPFTKRTPEDPSSTSTPERPCLAHTSPEPQPTSSSFTHIGPQQQSNPHSWPQVHSGLFTNTLSA